MSDGGYGDDDFEEPVADEPPAADGGDAPALPPADEPVGDGDDDGGLGGAAAPLLASRFPVIRMAFPLMGFARRNLAALGLGLPKLRL